MSLEATALPALIIVAGIIVTYLLAGLFGIAIAVTTMLALAGMVVALDAYGLVTDNAGGIAEMADWKPLFETPLDASMPSAIPPSCRYQGLRDRLCGLGALVLFAAYTEDLAYFAANATDYPFFSGSRSTSACPTLGCGWLVYRRPLALSSLPWACRRSGRAGGAVVEEVRRQFREIAGIMEGTAKPEYGRCVDMLTKPRSRR